MLRNLSRPGFRHFMRISNRQVHKGVEGTPPLRYYSVTERVGMYVGLAVVVLSYPTYVLLNLDNIRPKQKILLSPEVEEEMERLAAKRVALGNPPTPFI